MPWYALPAAIGLNYGEYTIRHALEKAGFRRCLARRKPSNIEEIRQARKAFVEIAQHWTKEQWRHVLWSDETWVNGTRRSRVYVTRRPGEEFDSTCVVEANPRGPGWMFWGSFSGIAGKGRGIFWEKDWGTITSESYCEHIVLIVYGWFRLTAIEGHIFMQHNARPHAAQATLKELQERHIPYMIWPPYSPDLNLMDDEVRENVVYRGCCLRTIYAAAQPAENRWSVPSATHRPGGASEPH
jgi:hypothetical protein